MIPAVWDTLPASLLLQGHTAGWRSVMKALQRSYYVLVTLLLVVLMHIAVLR